MIHVTWKQDGVSMVERFYAYRYALEFMTLLCGRKGVSNLCLKNWKFAEVPVAPHNEED